MGFYRKSGGGNVTPTTVKRRSGSSWVNVQTIKRRSGGAWVTVWSAYTPITVSAPNVSNSTPLGSGTSVTAGSSTASVTGGHSPYTYSWTYVSGDSFATGATTGATCTFSHTNKIAGLYSGVYRCTVSDGTSSSYKDITVSLQVGAA